MGVRQPPMAGRPPAQPARPAVGAFVAAMVPVGIILAEARVAGVASAHGEDFVVALHAGGERLHLGMDTGGGEQVRHLDEPGARAVEAHPVVVVHREVKRVIEQTDPFHDRPPPERRGLADTAPLQEPIEGVGGGGVVAEDALVFVDEVCVAIEQVPIGMIAKVGDDGGDGAGLEHVVGIEPGEDIAARLAQPLIDGVALAGVAPGAPEEALTVAAENAGGVVARAAVKDKVLDARIILAQYTVDGGPRAYSRSGAPVS